VLYYKKGEIEMSIIQIIGEIVKKAADSEIMIIFHKG
jgi:hypothetical protein